MRISSHHLFKMLTTTTATDRQRTQNRWLLQPLEELKIFWILYSRTTLIRTGLFHPTNTYLDFCLFNPPVQIPRQNHFLIMPCENLLHCQWLQSFIFWSRKYNLKEKNHRMVKIFPHKSCVPYFQYVITPMCMSMDIKCNKLHKTLHSCLITIKLKIAGSENTKMCTSIPFFSETTVEMAIS